MTLPGIQASEVSPVPIRWRWREHLPVSMLSLVAGPPGVAKSLLAMLITAEVSQTAGVIYSTLEDPIRQVARPRLEAAGARLSNVQLWSPLLPRDTELLERMIVEREAGLVVLDPVAAHLTVSIYNDQDVRRALTPLAEIADRTGATILLVSHVVKAASRYAHPLRAVGGSGGGLVGAARVVYLFGPNPADTDERVLACAKSNLGPEPPALVFEIDADDESESAPSPAAARLVLVREDRIEAKALLHGSMGERKPPEKRSQAAEFLVGYLRLGPRLAREIKEDALQHGISLATLRRAANEIGVIKPTGGRNSYWALPPELLELLEDEEEE